MKKILFAIFFLSVLTASAQTDTSKLPITITLKVKHIEYMAAQLQGNNTLADRDYRDSLVKYIGTGSDSTVNVVTHFSTGKIYKLVQDLLTEQANVSYGTIYELGNGSSGYTGIVTQLIGKWANGNDPEHLTALWLYNKIAYWLGLGQSIIGTKFYAGKNWLLTPIVQN